MTLNRGTFVTWTEHQIAAPFQGALASRRQLAPNVLQVRVTNADVASRLCQTGFVIGNTSAKVEVVTAELMAEEQRIFGTDYYANHLDLLPMRLDQLALDSPHLKRRWKTQPWMLQFDQAGEQSAQQRKTDPGQSLRHLLRKTVMIATIGACRDGQYQLDQDSGVGGQFSNTSRSVRIDSKPPRASYAISAGYEFKCPASLARPYHRTDVRVDLADCLEVVQRLQGEGFRPLMLNMANATHPGGGYLRGDGAQEETVFRRSNYYAALDSTLEVRSPPTEHGTGEKINKAPLYPMSLLGAIYTPDVCVFRGTEATGYPFLPDPFYVDCIAVAAIRDPPTTTLPGEGGEPERSWLTPDAESCMRAKIVTLFHVALAERHDSLVLSALGCGAFHNPPHHVALIFCSVIEQFQGWFKHITFAILDDHNASRQGGNVGPFADAIKRHEFGANKQEMIWPHRVPKAVCSDAACEQRLDVDHSQSHAHAPACPYGTECSKLMAQVKTETERDVHARLFFHPSACVDGGVCRLMADDLHCTLYHHPSMCRDQGRCVHTDEVHLRRFQHVPECRDGLRCTHRKDGRHDERYRHRQGTCGADTFCHLFKDGEHVVTHAHSFHQPCPHAPYGCMDESDQHAAEFSHACTLQRGGQCARVTAHDAVHLASFFHPVKPDCPDGGSCSSLLNDSHRAAYSHAGLLDFPGRCRDGYKCRLLQQTTIAADQHRVAYRHTAPPLLECASWQLNTKHGIDFRQNRKHLLQSCNLYNSKARLVVSDEIKSFVRRLRPVHKCSFQIFDSVMTHGALMSLVKMDDVKDPGFVADEALQHVTIKSMLGGHEWTRVHVEQFCALTITKRFAEETNKWNETKLDMKDPAVPMNMSARFSGKNQQDLTNAIAAIQHTFGQRINDIHDICMQLADASISLTREKVAMSIGYKVDKEVGTDDHVFCVVGPHKAHYYGDISVVLDQSIMSHPDANVSPIAATLFYSHCKDAETKTNSEIHRPWQNRGVATGVENDACVRLFHQSKLHPAVNDWDLVLGAELILRASKFKNRPSHLVTLSHIRSWWETADAHLVFEGHLPSVVPTEFIDQVIIPSNLYDKLSHQTRAKLDAMQNDRRARAQRPLVVKISNLDLDMLEPEQKREKDATRTQIVKDQLPYGEFEHEQARPEGFVITLPPCKKGELTTLPLCIDAPIVDERVGSSSSASSSRCRFIYFRAQGDQFFFVLKSREHAVRKTKASQLDEDTDQVKDGGDDVPTHASSRTHYADTNVLDTLTFFVSLVRDDLSYVSTQPPLSHGSKQPGLMQSSSREFTRGCHPHDFQHYCIRIDYDANTAMMQLVGTSAHAHRCVLEIKAPKPIGGYKQIAISALQQTAFSDIQVLTKKNTLIHAHLTSPTVPLGVDPPSSGASAGEKPGFLQRQWDSAKKIFRSGGDEPAAKSEPVPSRCAAGFACTMLQVQEKWQRAESTRQQADAAAHCAAEQHPCRFGPACLNLTNADHALSFYHYRIPPCTDGAQCRRRTDVVHRCEHAHAGLPHLLLPCREGTVCSKRFVHDHAERYAHQKQPTCTAKIMEAETSGAATKTSEADRPGLSHSGGAYAGRANSRGPETNQRGAYSGYAASSASSSRSAYASGRTTKPIVVDSAAAHTYSSSRATRVDSSSSGHKWGQLNVDDDDDEANPFGGGGAMSMYGDAAGESVVANAQLDAYGNAAGEKYDLAKDGAFAGYTIVIGSFCSEAELSQPTAALKKKGFTLRVTTSESQCAAWLSDAEVDIGWIISSRSAPSPDIVAAATAFHRSGRGLFIFADNDPYFTHANAILAPLYDVHISGNYHGTKMLEFDSAEHGGYGSVQPATGKFCKHLLFTGIQHLYEGVTISHPAPSAHFQSIATATDGHIAIAVLDPIPSKFNIDRECKVDRKVGRIVVDTGFTKLFVSWDTAGTERYIVNASIWLVGTERKNRRKTAPKKK